MAAAATPSLVLCEVEDQPRLERVVDELCHRGIEHVVFREPDRADEPTAVATLPLTDRQRRRLSKHQLWKGPNGA